EGEDDDLAGWQKGHEAFFTRNGGFDPEMMLVFEHFELVEDLANR
ncbi:MAG: ASCH domain-containing protein, partial [Maritimibacter sp.]